MQRRSIKLKPHIVLRGFCRIYKMAGTTIPFCIFNDGDLCVESSTHPEQGTPSLLISLEPLLSSVVRAKSSWFARANATEDALVCHLSAWNKREKLCLMASLRSCIEDALPSSMNAISTCDPLSVTEAGGSSEDKCVSPGQQTREDSFPPNNAFVETVVRGSFWRTCGRRRGWDTNQKGVMSDGEMLDMERLQTRVRELRRFLQQRHESEFRTKTTIAKSNGLRDVRGRRKETDEEETVDTRRMLAIMTGSTGGRSTQSAAFGSNEPFLVGLVCRELSGGSTPRVVTVRPLVTAGLTTTSCESGEDSAKGNLGNEENGDERNELSLSVMLLELEMDKLDFEKTQMSPMWQTLLSVTDFVYAVGCSTTINHVASMIDDVSHTVITAPGLRHVRVGCGARPAECPFLFYTVLGEAPCSMKQFTARSHCVGDLQAVFSYLLRMKEMQESTCCRNPFHWSMLLGHMWFLTKGAQGKTLSSPIEGKINDAIVAAVDLFVATAEGVLLAMYAMEPIPPLSVRGDDIGTVTAVPRHFTLEDVLHVANQLALLAFDRDVAPWVFSGQLTPRHRVLLDEYCGCRYHAARDELQRACHVASESLKKRISTFTTYSAAQLLRESSPGITSVWGPTGGEKRPDDVSLAGAIEECTHWIEQFLTTLLLPHYGVEEGVDNNNTNGRRHGPPCRMMESPIISTWVPTAKAVVFSEYAKKSLFPALQAITREQESVFRAKEIGESEAREALRLMEDNCIQLQRRCKRTEAQLAHQRCVAQEAKRRSDILRTQLHESCKCLQTLVKTCVGYEETHTSFTRKLRFRLKHGFATGDITPMPDSQPQYPSKHDREMDVDALVTTPSKDALRENLAATKREVTSSLSDDKNDVPVEETRGPSPLPCEQVALLKRMLRDAHQQLEVSHNTLLCLYEDAHGALRHLSTASAECSSVSLNDSRQSFLSVSQQATRTMTPVRRIGRSLNTSVGDAASGEISAVSLESTPKKSSARREILCHGVCRSDESQTLLINAFSKSPSREPTQVACASQCTDALPSTDHMPLHRRQQHGAEGKRRQQRRPFSTWTAAVPLPPVPDLGVNSAVDAIADLQRQRQEAVEALTQLSGRYEAVKRELDERNAALADVNCKHETEKAQWCAEREALLQRLCAATDEKHLAENEYRRCQKEVERWTQSWLEMMAVAAEEAENIFTGDAGVDTFAMNGENDGNEEDGNRVNGKHETTSICVTTPEEALRSGKMRLRSLMMQVQLTARERVRNVAEQHIVALQRKMEDVREEVYKEELQKRADVTATLLKSEEQAQMEVEVNRLREALAVMLEREGALRLDRNELALQKENMWCRLYRIEGAYMALFDVWEDTMLKRCAFILWQWSSLFMGLCEENNVLSARLKQSQAEVRYLEETLQEQAAVTQQTAEEIKQTIMQMERNRVAQSTAEQRVSELLRRLDQLVTLYGISFDTWEQAMTQRCELLVEHWNDKLLHHLQHQPKTERELTSREEHLPQRIGTHDPRGLLHELQHKKRRIAELEEALRQNKLRCLTLEGAVAQLNALLKAQRELGMAPPPSPPLISQEFGVLDTSPARTANVAPSVVNSFYASPNRACETSMREYSLLGGVTARSSPGERSKPPAVFPEAHHEVDSAKGLDGEEDVVEPRSLSWYLQSFSAIESTLSR
ncbi:hypothetical protein MOQ_008259 [Trypanosoma cruzi marinkellei]|uniref:C2H2-type domain-containing protein n=1 Tax=Trypanosoma cruzi marinkellei TaxID=85056 RepID=K2NGB1_TRYCR|nr:hypothetical protein MOQ_008259 [Trypanosoma cruzi marinkellei]